MTRGRPRQFDTDAALDQALALFARDGFAKASVQELADCMGICKPSLYSAYGNKETLFIEALRRYAAHGAAQRERLLNDEPDGRLAVESLLRLTAHEVTAGETAGCLLVSEAAATPSAYSPVVRAAVAEALGQGAHQLRERLARAQREGQLAPTVNVDMMTTYFSTVMAGMTVQARNGATASELCAAATVAMQVWIPATDEARSAAVSTG